MKPQGMKRSRIHGLGWGLLFVLLSTSVNGMQVSARVAVPTTEYRNVTLKELVSVYEQAYGAQKFHVNASTRQTMPEGDQVVRLVLDMANPAHETRKKAQLSFQFHSPGKDACTPCSVTREMFSVGEHDEYTGEEWDAFQRQLVAADKRATDEIARKLGASVAQLEEYPSYFGKPVEHTLCRAGETIMFSCPSRNKQIAVCAAPAENSAFGLLHYRFGDNQHLDLEFPKNPIPLPAYASGNHPGDGSRGNLIYLRLANGETTYTVFSESVTPSYSGEGAREIGGVLVEKRGKVLAKRMCDDDEYIYSGMLLDSKFFGVTVPVDTQGVTGFPAYK